MRKGKLITTIAPVANKILNPYFKMEKFGDKDGFTFDGCEDLAFKLVLEFVVPILSLAKQY